MHAENAHAMINTARIDTTMAITVPLFREIQLPSGPDPKILSEPPTQIPVRQRPEPRHGVPSKKFCDVEMHTLPSEGSTHDSLHGRSSSHARVTFTMLPPSEIVVLASKVTHCKSLLVQCPEIQVRSVLLELLLSWHFSPSALVR